MKIQIRNNSYFWLSIFGLSFILFQLISYKIRPDYTGDNELVKYFLGVAPNFFPAIGIPALIYAIFIVSKLKYPQFTNNNAFVISISIGVAGLIIWEFLQIFSKKLSFDWHDILWTIAGGIICSLLGLKPDRSRN